jgi:GNAT superfamily N-acetyltransferase
MSNLEIGVRPASLTDARAIAELISFLGYATTTEQMRARLHRLAEDDSYATFVAIVDGRTVGVIGACVCPLYENDSPVGRIVALSVDPASQGRGVGADLVRQAEVWLKMQGAAAVIVNSGNDRPAAHSFYECLGYSATGVRFRKQL